MRKLNLLALVCLTVILQGCTITYYELRNEITPKIDSSKGGGCDFNYALTMDDYRRFRTIGNQPNPRAAEDLDKYIKATQAVFAQKGCKANKIEEKDKAEFKIDVLRAPQLSALPQEWLWEEGHANYLGRSVVPHRAKSRCRGIEKQFPHVRQKSAEAILVGLTSR